MLDVVELGELAVRIRDGERLELLQRLPAEVRTIDEEEHAPGARELDQPVGDVRRGERLARAGRHLDQRPRPVLRQRALEVSDRGRLRRTQPLSAERRQLGQAVTERRRSRVLVHLADPGGERLRAVEPEHLSAARLRVERIREPRLDTSRLVGERQRTLQRALHPVGQAVEVLRRLPLDARQCRAGRLRLDHADRFTIDEQEVVDPPVRRLEDELPDGDAARSGEVHVARVLDRPARGLEHLVDLDPGLVLGGEVRLHRHNRKPRTGDRLSQLAPESPTLRYRCSGPATGRAPTPPT